MNDKKAGRRFSGRRMLEEMKKYSYAQEHRDLMAKEIGANGECLKTHNDWEMKALHELNGGMLNFRSKGTLLSNNEERVCEMWIPFKDKETATI